MKRTFTALVAAFLCAPAALFAYPGTPDTWTWKYHEEGLFVPLQLSATTDQDGRLRTLFLDDSQPYSVLDGNVTRRVNPPIMQSFRVFPDGTMVNEYRGLTVDDYTNASKKAAHASRNAALEPRRSGIYSVGGGDATFAVGGAYRRLQPAENFGAGRSVSHKNHFISMARRPVLDNAAYVESASDTLDIAATTTKQNLDVTLNEAILEVRFVTTTSPDLSIRYSQTNSAGLNSVFLRSLSSAAPADWAANRIFTGGSLKMTSDRRDFYAFVTSYKPVSGGGFTTEARIFRLRTAGNITDPIIGIQSVTSNLVAESTLPEGTPISSALVYPQLGLPRTDDPQWVVWGNPALNKVFARKRVPGTTGTSEENNRTIANGYIGAFGVTSGELGTGSGPSIALDALGVLHFTYKSGTYALYGRENTNGVGYVSWAFFGNCTGAPVVAVGPGQYPYIVYKGIKSGSPNNIDKLVVVYTAELQAAYKGDYEDRDKDGRLGLIERAQGSSDSLVESAAEQASLNLTSRIVQVAPGDRRFELSYRMDRNSVRQGSSDVWHLPDGGDTLEIRPAYASKPEGPYLTGLNVVDDFTTASARFVTVRHPASLTPSTPSRFFTFKVRRIQGPY